MYVDGLLDEVEALVAGGVPPDAHAFKAIGYREALRVLSGEWTRDEAVEATVTATRRLAKRQMTWLRREERLTWLRSSRREEAVDEILHVLEEAIGKRQ